MVAPSGDGATRCMQIALEMAQCPVDYINAHGTATPAGDSVELKAIQRVFGDKVPYISSTKALTGHSLGCGRCTRSDLLLVDDARRLCGWLCPY
jgi:3-oxoacyl-[acyl-carrier-protein] synthase-1